MPYDNEKFAAFKKGFLNKDKAREEMSSADAIEETKKKRKKALEDRMANGMFGTKEEKPQ